MSFFSCTGRAKKKYQKFGLIEIFRESVHKKKPQKSNEDQLNKFVNELAEENVCYKSIQEISWNGVPHCTLSHIQVLDRKSGNTFSAMPWCIPRRTPCGKKGRSTTLCWGTTGGWRICLKERRKPCRPSRAMSSESALNSTQLLRRRHCNSC